MGGACGTGRPPATGRLSRWCCRPRGKRRRPAPPPGLFQLHPRRGGGLPIERESMGTLLVGKRQHGVVLCKGVGASTGEVVDPAELIVREDPEARVAG